MSGRIKLLTPDGTVLNPDRDFPEINAAEYYQVPGEFDAQCGTHGLDAYQLPNDQCPSHFVCPDNTTSMEKTQDDVTNATYTYRGGNEVNEQYAACLDAMNCHMLAGITNGYNTTTMTEASLFIYQMIPHHENAINMAKNLLRLKGTDSNILNCTDYMDEEDQQCIMETLLRDVINGQNHEIQLFRQYLEAKEFAPEGEQCTVEIKTILDGGAITDNTTDTAPVPSAPTTMMTPTTMTTPTASKATSPGTKSAADASLSLSATLWKQLVALWLLSTATTTAFVFC